MRSASIRGPGPPAPQEWKPFVPPVRLLMAAGHHGVAGVESARVGPLGLASRRRGAAAGPLVLWQSQGISGRRPGHRSLAGRSPGSSGPRDEGEGRSGTGPALRCWRARGLNERPQVVRASVWGGGRKLGLS